MPEPKDEAQAAGALHYSALVFAGSTQLLSEGPGRYRVENSLSGRGLDIDGRDLQLLRLFSEPTIAARAVHESRLEPSRAATLVEQLRALGILTPVGLHTRLPAEPTSRPATTLFR